MTEANGLLDLYKMGEITDSFDLAMYKLIQRNSEKIERIQEELSEMKRDVNGIANGHSAKRKQSSMERVREPGPS
jgi:uncharacterized protein (UPF0335 family)